MLGRGQRADPNAHSHTARHSCNVWTITHNIKDAWISERLIVPIFKAWCVCVCVFHTLKPGYSSRVSSLLCTFSTSVRLVSISKNDVKIYGSFHDVLGMACTWRWKCPFCQLHWVMKDTVAFGSELWLLGSRVGACVGFLTAEESCRLPAETTHIFMTCFFQASFNAM